MNVIVESITLEGGMQNASGVVLLSLGPNIAPTRMAFAGTLTVIDGQTTPVPAPAPATLEPKAKRKAPAKKSAEEEGGMKWTDSILQALGDTSLTTSELFEHCMRIRGVQIRNPEDRKKQMVRMQAAMTECKRRGLLLRTLDNQLDKWKANTVVSSNPQSWEDAIRLSLSEDELIPHTKLFEAAIRRHLGRAATEKAELDHLRGQFSVRLNYLRRAGRVIELLQGGISFYRLPMKTELAPESGG